MARFGAEPGREAEVRVAELVPCSQPEGRRPLAHRVDRQRRAGGPKHFERWGRDRKSTRLNSSHGYISYAVFCLKKKRAWASATCMISLVIPSILMSICSAVTPR